MEVLSFVILYFEMKTFVQLSSVKRCPSMEVPP